VRSFGVGFWLVAQVGLAVAFLLFVGGDARSANQAAGLIAFTRADGIYVMRADGSGVRAVRRGSVAALAAGLEWSPDGRKLAFAAEDAIWVMDADGSDLVRLVGPGDTAGRAFMSPTWSPDGGRIACTAFRDGARDIWVMDADGNNRRRLVWTPRRFELEVDWSPVGRRIAFSSDGYFPAVYVMNVNGSNLRKLTLERGFEAMEPDWSPDARRIAFTRWQGSFGTEELYVVNANGTQRVRLTNNYVADRDPTWSPDGSTIAFERSGFFPESKSEIYVMNADGTGVKRLTHNHVADTSPAWRPIAAL
jgi:TolB protein